MTQMSKISSRRHLGISNARIDNMPEKRQREREREEGEGNEEKNNRPSLLIALQKFGRSS